MADELQPDPATDLVEGAVDSAATQGGGNNSAADDIRNALGGDGDSRLDNSPHEQMRRQIGDDLAKALTTETPPKVEAPAAETDSKPGRARGPDGRFIPTPQETAAGIDPNEQQPATEAVQPKGPPTSWTKEMQARWGELPPEFQAEIQKREADVEKGFEKYKRFRDHEPTLDFVEKVAPRLGLSSQQLLQQYGMLQDAMLDPAKRSQALSLVAEAYGVDHVPPQLMQAAHDMGKQAGISGGKLVEQLLTAQYYLNNPQTKRQAIDYLVQHFKVDMGQPAGHGQVAEPTWVDPDIAELRQQNAQILGAISQYQQNAQLQAQQYQQQVLEQKNLLINQFASEKGPDGQPLRPYLQAPGVMPHMVAGIAQIRAANPSISDQEALQQAYDNAVWSNPDTRSQVLNATMIAEKAKEAEKARERAQAAARGAVSPATASPQGPPAAQPLKGDLRDQMRAVYEQIAT